MVSIVDCGRTMAGEVVAFDIKWDGDLPSDGSVVWSMLVTSQDGEEQVCLGYERVGGEFASQFVGAAAADRREEVAEDADFRESEITVRFPANVVGVAIEWPVWQAVLIVDGEQVAEQAATVH